MCFQISRVMHACKKAEEEGAQTPQLGPGKEDTAGEVLGRPP